MNKSTEKTEKPKNEPIRGKNGGYRPGSGRKKGGENQKTKDKKIVKKEIEQRVMRSYGKIIDAQMNLAQGCQYLFVIKTIKKYSKKDDSYKFEKQKPEIVESPETIQAYLAGELDNEDQEYYYITAQKPDSKAGDSLLDRTFGKSTQVVGGDEDKPIEIKYNAEGEGIAKKFEEELKNKLKQ